MSLLAVAGGITLYYNRRHLFAFQGQFTDFDAKIEFEKGIVKTGVVGLIKGKNPTKRLIKKQLIMDNFSCQRHTIPIRISQLTVLRYEINHLI